MFSITLHPGAVAIQCGETIYTFAGSEKECIKEVISKCCKKTATGYEPAHEGTSITEHSLKVRHTRVAHDITGIPVASYRSTKELPTLIPKEEIDIESAICDSSRL